MRKIFKQILRQIGIHNWQQTSEGWYCNICDKTVDGIMLRVEDGY